MSRTTQACIRALERGDHAGALAMATTRFGDDLPDHLRRQFALWDAVTPLDAQGRQINAGIVYAAGGLDALRAMMGRHINHSTAAFQAMRRRDFETVEFLVPHVSAATLHAYAYASGDAELVREIAARVPESSDPGFAWTRAFAAMASGNAEMAAEQLARWTPSPHPTMVLQRYMLPELISPWGPAKWTRPILAACRARLTECGLHESKWLAPQHRSLRLATAEDLPWLVELCGHWAPVAERLATDNPALFFAEIDGLLAPPPPDDKRTALHMDMRRSEMIANAIAAGGDPGELRAEVQTVGMGALEWACTEGSAESLAALVALDPPAIGRHGPALLRKYAEAGRLKPTGLLSEHVAAPLDLVSRVEGLRDRWARLVAQRD